MGDIVLEHANGLIVGVALKLSVWMGVESNLGLLGQGGG